MSPDEPARLHELHARMVDAVLSGDGMREVAQIAARRTGAPVAVVIPSLGHELVEPADAAGDVLAILRPWVDGRLAGHDPAAPEPVVCDVPVASGDEPLGAIALLAGGDDLPQAELRGILHLAAMAAVTELALVEGRQQLEDELRGSFVELLRAGGELDAAEVTRRAARMGCDLARGAVILAADPPPQRTHRLMAAIKADCPDAFVQQLEGRVYAVLPADDGPDARDRVTAIAATLARRLRAHAAVGISSFHANPAELGRAVREADMIVDVVGRSDVPPESVTDGTYRLLVGLLASDRGQLDHYHEQTIAPIARYDEQYRTELVGTLAAYLDHDCNMNATAAALYAHRHTVAYRLERIKELTGLDTARHEHRERLSVGVKIHRLTGR